MLFICLAIQVNIYLASGGVVSCIEAAFTLQQSVSDIAAMFF